MQKRKIIPIGKNIHYFRKLKKISLVELAQASGVQIATLSRIENSQMTGTLESHMAIAEALGVPLDSLYKDILKSSQQGSTSSFGSIEPYIPNNKASVEILVKDASLKKMLPTVITIKAGGKTSIEKGLIGIEKLIYVLTGGVDLVMADQTTSLKKDSYCYITAVSDHYIYNPHKIPAKVLCISSPVKI